MKAIDFLLLYEHAQREMLGLLVIAKELIKRGYSVGLCSIRDVHKASRLVQVRVISVPFLYRRLVYRDIVGPFLKNSPDIKIIDRHEEQIWADHQVDKWVLADEYARTAYHLCWGSSFKELLLSRSGEANKIWIVGCPRAAIIYAIKNEKEYLRKKLHISSDFERVFLMAINFGGAFVDPIRQQRAEMLRVYFYKHFKPIVEKYPNILFVIRPHPSEVICNKNAEADFLNYRNVVFSTEGTAAEAVAMADVVGTYTSSVAVEAWMIEKPSFGFMGDFAQQFIPDYPITRLTEFYPDMNIEAELDPSKFGTSVSFSNSKAELRAQFIHNTYGNPCVDFVKLSADAYVEILGRTDTKPIPIKLRPFSHEKETIRNFLVRKLNMGIIHPSWREVLHDIKKYPIREYIRNNQHVLKDNNNILDKLLII